MLSCIELSLENQPFQLLLQAESSFLLSNLLIETVIGLIYTAFSGEFEFYSWKEKVLLVSILNLTLFAIICILMTFTAFQDNQSIHFYMMNQIIYSVVVILQNVAYFMQIFSTYWKENWITTVNLTFNLSIPLMTITLVLYVKFFKNK